MNIEQQRAAFEAFMSDNGKFPQAIERDANGNYLLMQAASSWHVWQAAIKHDRQSRHEENAAVQIVAELAAIIPLKGTLKATQTGRTMVEYFKGLVDCQGRDYPRCPNCDGTGDVHSIDGEWRGVCHCPAGAALSADPVKGPSENIQPLLDTIEILCNGLEWNIENHPTIMTQADNEALGAACTLLARYQSAQPAANTVPLPGNAPQPAEPAVKESLNANELAAVGLIGKWQDEHGVSLDSEDREGKMVVLRHYPSGEPSIWCDPEIADLVDALNNTNISTIASCSGHGHRPGNIALSDGRELIIARDYEEARLVESHFPGINREPSKAAKLVVPDAVFLGCARMGMAEASDDEVMNYVRMAMDRMRPDPQHEKPAPTPEDEAFDELERRQASAGISHD